MQTAYVPHYCLSERRAGTRTILNVDLSLTQDYCRASQVRDRNAPLSQWIDTLNYDLVASSNLLAGLVKQSGIGHQSQK